MNKITLLSFFTIITILFGCDKPYKFALEISKKNTIESFISASLTEVNNQSVDSIQFFINGKAIPSTNNSISFKASEFGLGKHVISALAFYPGKTKKINNSFEIFPTQKPAIYNFEIINSYPHDTEAYTQGLEFHDGYLYETTGRRGQSTLRKVDIKTGKVLQKISLDDRYFGEGMTIFNNQIIWLTWESKKGFVYDLDTFEQIGSFDFDKSAEGWGLTNDGTHLIKSDGTHKIWFLDPETRQEKFYQQVYTIDRAVDNLNELELVNGKLYANKYQQNAIVIIDPKTGIVEGIANLKGLKNEMEKTQKLVPQDEVLNGIAYDAANDRLFVTGKNWGKLFEIKLTTK